MPTLLRWKGYRFFFYSRTDPNPLIFTLPKTEKKSKSG